MRKLSIGAIAGAVFLLAAGIAWAVTDQVNYSATLPSQTKAKPGAPGNSGYKAVLDITTPEGTQPDSAPLTELFFSNGLQLNGSKFAACRQSAIDGQTAFPRACKRAVVGKGNAVARIGQAGHPSAVTENLSVTAVNGKKRRNGDQLYLVLKEKPGQPVAIPNRVIAGDVSKARSPFGTRVAFHVPPELQARAGAQIALTHFDVSLFSDKGANRKTVAIKRRVGRRKRTVRITFLQVKKCPAAHVLPSKATVHFNDDAGNPGGPVVTNTGSVPCK